ncbi:MAG: hypothetical protein VCB42_10345 [Myxococcota bacterium]
MSVQHLSAKPLAGPWIPCIAVLAWLVLGPVAAAGEGDGTGVAAPVAPLRALEICRAADPAASRTPLVWMRQAVLAATTPAPGSVPASSPEGHLEVLNGRGYNYAGSSRSPSFPVTPGRVTTPATP